MNFKIPEESILKEYNLSFIYKSSRSLSDAVAIGYCKYTDGDLYELTVITKTGEQILLKNRQRIL